MSQDLGCVFARSSKMLRSCPLQLQMFWSQYLLGGGTECSYQCLEEAQVTQVTQVLQFLS